MKRVNTGLIFELCFKNEKFLKGFLIRFLSVAFEVAEGWVWEFNGEEEEEEEKQLFCVGSGEWKGHVANWVIREF